jgi:diguanylate cyclase (GGDEF)-like protein
MSITKILIVEDELLIANNLAKKLEKLGYQIVGIASTGETAIETVRRQQIDLILMDIVLKGNIDGIETATKIQAIINIPIIYLTAYADEDTLERAEQTNSYGYILKPCRERELHATIRIALKKHQELTQVKKSQVCFDYEELNTSSNVLMSNNIHQDLISYDPITKLPTSLTLREKFAECLINWGIGEGSDTNSLAIPVVSLNIDRFNRVNNTLGHEGGNELLKITSQRLKNCLNSDIKITHLNADQFVLIFPPVQHQSQVNQTINQLKQEFYRPFFIGGQEVFLTISIGIAFYPWDETKIDQLLRKAHQAMTIAKRLGGNQFRFYLSISAQEDNESLSLETDLRYAIEEEQLQLYYQPQVSLKTGQIVGAETLIRWVHPTKGMISPVKFIPLAEENGLIETIDRWVLLTACQQMKTWQLADFSLQHIAVNLSGRQFNYPNLGDRLIEILTQIDLEPQYLEIELTESTLVADLQQTREQLQTISSLGIKISVDDFGTGYSSLSYLQNFPFDVLKIDRCFVQNIEQNPKNAVITSALIKMAHQLNLKVVAEGVETKAELKFLASQHCDEIQGYFFSPPIPVDKFEQLIQENKQLDSQFLFDSQPAIFS